MELNSKEKGNLTELQCITAVYELGYKAAIPYGENSRYDFILDTGDKLLKIQVKTSSTVDEDSFKFSCRSTRVNSQGNVSKKYTAEEIDYFATYYNGKCYLVPVQECGTDKKLRYNYPANGQKKGINLAENYELQRVLEQLK